MIKVNLDKILKEREISIREFSRMIDYNFEAVRRVHNNDSTRLSTVILERACRVLNVTISDLLEYED